MELLGKQHLKDFVHQLKEKNYGSEEAQREAIEERLKERIVSEIWRLRAVEDDQKEMGKVLERATGKTTEDRWKLVVLSSLSSSERHISYCQFKCH